ncbi:MAG TPA: hypothetical protein VHO73_02535 [Methylomirabilota bacterium]|nr:hypothetical protein [Methylomirabilota bacterium]
MLAAVGLLAAVVSPAFAQPASPPGLQKAIAAQERHTNALLAIPGVIGTAVGLGASGPPVVKVFTESRAVAGVPHVLDGVPVVVEVTGKLVARHHRPGHGAGGDGEAPAVDPTARFDRPVPIGVSTGHPEITAGTIGARVKQGNVVYALSNNHVYANTNDATVGDSVLQPGPFDGGVDPDDAIGTLAAFHEIDFGGDNVIDAAIALSSTADLGRATPANGYGTPRSTPVAAVLTQRVQKYGRTTGLTSGRVDAVNATVNIEYNPGQVARFVRQIIIRPGTFSAGGDSGSLVVVKGGPNDRSPVGLLFAGSLVVTIANPIGDVLARFGVTVDGE